MKKLAVFLLCLSMLSASALTAYAEDSEVNAAPGEATIGTVVPDSHKITVTVTGNVDFTVNGKSGTEFEVERLSEPVIEIKAKDGERIVKVTLNGEDITDKIVDGKYTLPPVYENEALDIQVETEAIPDESSEPESSVPDSSTPDSSEPESSVPDSSTPDSSEPESSSVPDSSSEPDSSSIPSSSSKADSSKAQSSSTAPTNNGGSTANPVTGMVGGVSIGSGLVLAALMMTKKKSKYNEEE